MMWGMVLRAPGAHAARLVRGLCPCGVLGLPPNPEAAGMEIRVMVKGREAVGEYPLLFLRPATIFSFLGLRCNIPQGKTQPSMRRWEQEEVRVRSYGSK